MMNCVRRHDNISPISTFKYCCEKLDMIRIILI